MYFWGQRNQANIFTKQSCCSPLTMLFVILHHMLSQSLLIVILPTNQICVHTSRSAERAVCMADCRKRKQTNDSVSAKIIQSQLLEYARKQMNVRNHSLIHLWWNTWEHVGFAENETIWPVENFSRQMGHSMEEETHEAPLSTVSKEASKSIVGEDCFRDRQSASWWTLPFPLPTNESIFLQNSSLGMTRLLTIQPSMVS